MDHEYDLASDIGQTFMRVTSRQYSRKNVKNTVPRLISVKR